MAWNGAQRGPDRSQRASARGGATVPQLDAKAEAEAACFRAVKSPLGPSSARATSLLAGELAHVNHHGQ